MPQQSDSQGHYHKLSGSWARLPAAREPLGLRDLLLKGYVQGGEGSPGVRCVDSRTLHQICRQTGTRAARRPDGTDVGEAPVRGGPRGLTTHPHSGLPPLTLYPGSSPALCSTENFWLWLDLLIPV